MSAESVEIHQAEPSARIVHQFVPMATPGCCVICGQSSHEKGFCAFQNPGLDFEFYGTVIFCYDCVRELSRLWGFATPEEVQLLKDSVEHFQTQLIEVNSNLQQLGEENDSLIGTIARKWPVRDVPPLTNVELPESTEQSVEESGNSETDSESSINSELEPSESSDEPRSDDVRGNSTKPTTLEQSFGI